MNITNPAVDAYFSEGCGRCPLGGTPECKVHNWQEELRQLRMIVLDCGLTEELKWKVPCYTFGKKNVAILAAFKDYCAISFFKGALMKDEQGILEKPGDNTQAVRLIRFTNVHQVLKMEPVVRAYIKEAIDLEKSGKKVGFKKELEPMPEELERTLEEDPAFRSAFEALTPGRQRGYILYFSSARQSATRQSRIEKYREQIFKGKGLQGQ